jgi:hypothetical protein
MDHILNKTPLDVFNLPQDYTWNQLKQSFKTLAIYTHPDKGGNEKVFNHVTNCFKHLAKELKTKQNNKTHQELKEQHKTDDLKPMKPPLSTNGDFHSQFNKIFTENHFVDEDIDFGYGNEMDKSTASRKDFKIKNVFEKTKVKPDTFNHTFNKIVPSNAVIKYKEPEPMYSIKNIHYAELGKKTEDYSGKSGNISYTDYRIAHSENRIPTTDNRRKVFHSVEQYQQYSDRYIQKQETQSEIKRRLQNEQKIKDIEENRQRAVQEKDNRIFQHYEKISRLFLT